MIRLVSVSLLFVVLAAGRAAAVEDPPSQPTDKKAIAAMLAAKGAPAEEHKILEALVGDFDVDGKMGGGPAGPPLSFKTRTTSTWVLGNRFVHAVSRPAEGEELPIESISYFGFDKRTKKYFWWGIDSTDTYSVFAEGEYDPATKTMTLFGENLEPGIGKMKYKTVIKIESNDAYSIAIVFQAPEAMRAQAPAGSFDADGWFTVVEMNAKRRK